MPTTPARPARVAPKRWLPTTLAVSAGAGVFAVLLVLVVLRWAPLESLDQTVAARLNAAVAPRPALVTTLRTVTWLGSGWVLWPVTSAAFVVLLIGHRYRPAAFLAIAGVGALVLDPVVKSLVGRVRPVVAHPVAHAGGFSFPSGHALGSILCYGALLMVFLPARGRRWRTTAICGAAALVVTVGLSRLMLGVHFLSDVVGAWALGVAWLGMATYAACRFDHP